MNIQEQWPGAKIVMTFPVLYSGWECDGEATIIQTKKGEHKLIMTSHGQPYEAKPQELMDKINEYRKAIVESQKALIMVI